MTLDLIQSCMFLIRIVSNNDQRKTDLIIIIFFRNISEPLQRKTWESALKIDDRFLPHSLQFMSEIHATIQHYINGTLHKASLKLSEVCNIRLASTDIILGCLVLFLFGAEDNK